MIAYNTECAAAHARKSPKTKTDNEHNHAPEDIATSSRRKGIALYLTSLCVATLRAVGVVLLPSCGGGGSGGGSARNVIMNMFVLKHRLVLIVLATAAWAAHGATDAALVTVLQGMVKITGAQSGTASPFMLLNEGAVLQ